MGTKLWLYMKMVKRKFPYTMEDMKKTYVLDTNVLLSDANSLFAFQENDVVLPLIVLEELDRHKDRQDDTGREAREVSRRLNVLLKDAGDISKGIDLGNMGTLFLMSIEQARGKAKQSSLKVVEELPSELNGKSGDNIILTLCLALREAVDNLVLVTRDVLLSVKAKALGITCETYKRMQVTASADTLYSGAMSIEADINFNKAYEGKLEFGDLGEFLEEIPYPNQFITVKATTSNQSVLLRYLGPNKCFKVVNKDSVDKLQTRNKEQQFALDLLLDPEIKLVTLVGSAGVGKTVLAIAAGLEQTIGAKGKVYKSLVVSKPTHPMGGEHNNIGFLPGELVAKLDPWLAPIKDNLRFLMNQGKKTKLGEETLSILFEQGIIEVEALMYIRGRSIANAFMIIDESQSLSAHELKTIVTRVGEGTKIVLTGDVLQIDNPRVDSTSNGLAIAVEKFKNSPLAGHVSLTQGCRSPLATLAAQILT